MDVTKDDRTALFLFDTGAAITHLSHPLDDGARRARSARRRPARTLLDTGTDTLVVLTETPGTGQVASTTDAFGNPMQLVWGTAQLAWERDEPRRVPAWRTRAHPTFEEHAKLLGGADAILGLAALGNRRLFFEVAHGRVHVEP